MYLAHSFRLRDPWQCELADDGGRRWSRVFHRPTGLEPDDRLVLVLSGAPTAAQVSINGHHFAPQGPESCTLGDSAAGDARPATAVSAPFQFDVTDILADANSIELLIPPAACGLQPTASPSFPYDARLAIVAYS